jgi:hypothetical protein
MPTGEVDHRPDVRLAWTLGLVVAASALAPVITALVLGERLPAEVPRHYGAGGHPTALWPLWTSVAVLSGVTLVVGGLCAATAVVLRLPLTARRGVAWTITWVVVLLGGMKTGALIGVRDVTDPMTSGSISATAVVAMLTGMIVGLPVAAMAREEPHGRSAAGPPPDDLPREPSGAAGAWRSPPLTSRALILVLVATGLLLLVPALAVGPLGDGAWLLLLALATLAPAAVFARVRVVIEPQGLHVRGLGIRLLHVPIEEVAGADVVDHLDAFWEFGGWGLRVDVHGRTGLVSRSGEALRVVRGDDTQVLVTVDDAATAAAALNTLADHHHAGTGT